MNSRVPQSGKRFHYTGKHASQIQFEFEAVSMTLALSSDSAVHAWLEKDFDASCPRCGTPGFVYACGHRCCSCGFKVACDD